MTGMKALRNRRGRQRGSGVWPAILAIVCRASCRLTFRLLAAIFVAAVSVDAVLASDYTLGALRVEQPFARATPGMAKNGAAYLAISNAGDDADRLLEARSDVAARTELHTHINDSGVMRMRPIEGGIAVPAGGKAELAPGGDHVMLMGLRAPLAEGDSFPLTLVFERAGAITVEVPIEGIAAGSPGHHGGSHHQ